MHLSHNPTSEYGEHSISSSRLFLPSSVTAQCHLIQYYMKTKLHISMFKLIWSFRKRVKFCERCILVQNTPFTGCCYTVAYLTRQVTHMLKGHWVQLFSACHSPLLFLCFLGYCPANYSNNIISFRYYIKYLFIIIFSYAKINPINSRNGP